MENSNIHSPSGILPPEVSAAVVSWCCQREAAQHLDDVMTRRTSWRHYYRNHFELAGNVARWMAAELGWSHERRESELQNYRRLSGAAEIPAPHIGNFDISQSENHLSPERACLGPEPARRS